MEDLWDKWKGHFNHLDAQVHFANSMEVTNLDEAINNFEPFHFVVGIGGGRALDAAKYFAWQKIQNYFMYLLQCLLMQHLAKDQA